MIIVRSPLRISLGGGGTDFKSYYSENEGFLISAAIDKYVYVTIIDPFSIFFFLKYSEQEITDTISNIQHPIIRETLSLITPNIKKIELTTLADIPSGTGLGSSGSFTCALISALYAHKGHYIDKMTLAELACKIEIEKLNQPIGKQDQFISAFGGINAITFKKNDNTLVEPLRISSETTYDLEDNLLLFFTGFSRKASDILQDQQDKSILKDKDMLQNLGFIKSIGLESRKALEKNNLNEFGKLMHQHWLFKKQRSVNISNTIINDLYDAGFNNGAAGGKLVGAGGGGFLMFYANNKLRLRNKMKDLGLPEVRFKFDYDGTKVVLRP